MPPGGAVAEAESPVFYRSFREFLSQLPGVSKRFWVLVLATGVVSGLGSLVLLRLLAAVTHAAWGTAGTLLEAFQHASPVRRVLVPTAGGLLVTGSMLALKRRLGGHGTAGIIESIWVHQGRLQPGRALLRAGLAVVAVGMGASLGREGALVQTGAASGSWLADRFGVTRDQARLLVACGAASGLAAAYNVPIGGALFGLEVLLGSFALELFGPVVVSCVTATIIARVFEGTLPSYVIPAYGLMKTSELLTGVLMAPLLGVAAALFVKVLGWVEVQLYRVPPGPARFLPPLAMALLGVAAVEYPQLLGNGYDTVKAALLGTLPLTLLLLLPVLKLAATALCAGCGVPGGLFTPSLFFGALLGGGLGELAGRLWPSIGAPPGAFALLGMASMLAGTTHAAVSSVLIIFELTGDYDVILPLMVAAAVSAATSRMIDPDSLYTAPLRRRGVKLPELPRPAWLRSTPAAALLTDHVERCPPELPFDELVPRVLALPAGRDLYVVDRSGTLLGTIRLDALKEALLDRGLLSMLVAADVMEHEAPLTATMALSDVAARFAELEVERLPVVDGAGKLLGTIAKRDLLKHGKF